MQRDETLAATLRTQWTLDPEVDFLNHGSFGACPRPVLETQSRLRAEMERQPVRFLVDTYPALLAGVRQRVAAFVKAEERDVVFTHNATSGVNAVLRSLTLCAGDELLTTDHVYSACANTLRYVEQRTGARVVVVPLPFPVASPQDIVERIAQAVTARTRIALIDHVTSMTGLVLPVADIVKRLKARGVETIVDGAHAMAMLDLDLTALSAGYYAANFHKWLCAPKGAALLWARRDLQAGIVPTVVSHGFAADPAERFQRAFDWTGTDDPTARLCVPAALDFFAQLLPGGIAEARAKNHELALFAQTTLCDALQMRAPVPPEMLGSLVSVPLPPPRSQAVAPTALYAELRERGFETCVFPWPAGPPRILRVSCQVYNTPGQYERLARCLVECLQQGL